MARVFLSYDHDDAQRATPIASAFERAGHEVWWDRHIQGGFEYVHEIEAAVEKAQAVVVLWSERSVMSAWVRDEAAEGRDQRKLVPVLIDAVKPPMGFRQFQTIDLSTWTGRGQPPALQQILTCIDRLAGQLPREPAKATGVAAPHRQVSRAARFAAIATVVLAAIAVSYFLVSRDSKSSAPVVAVTAADNGSQSRSLADDLFIKLGSLQSANADALQLVGKGSDTGPDLSFKVAQQLVDGQTHATVALLAGNGGLLWSREFGQEQGTEADLRQQIAYSAGVVLKCATEAMAPGHQKLVDRTLKLYLAGCARYTSDTAGEPQSLVEIFGKVTELAPDFEAGWAKLLAAETATFVSRGARDPAIRKSLQMHIKQARKLNPTMAEAYNAEAWMHEFRDINGWMPLADLAVEKNPFNVELLGDHSYDMFLVGRTRKGLIYARRAVQADPLSPRARVVLVLALARTGEIEAAKDALSEAERLWPGASNLIECRFYLMAKYADADAALEMLRSGKVRRSFITPAMESFLEARVDPRPAKVERAVQEARKVSHEWFPEYIDTLAEFRRKEELIRALAVYDPEVFLATAQVFDAKYSFLRDDPRFMGIMKRWGSQLNYWRKSGNWPDFCFGPGLPYDCKTEAAKLG